MQKNRGRPSLPRFSQRDPRFLVPFFTGGLALAQPAFRFGLGALCPSPLAGAAFPAYAPLRPKPPFWAEGAFFPWAPGASFP